MWKTKILNSTLFFFFSCGCLLMIYYASSTLHTQNLGARRPPVVIEGPSVEIDGRNWTQVLDWDFSNGSYPSGWGWGEWEIIDELLTGRDPDGAIAVYFIPFTHGGDFVLETKVRFVRGDETHDTEAHLLTRDNANIELESGMVFFANNDRMNVRHMVEMTDLLHETVTTSVSTSYDQWYVLRFMMHDGQLKAFLDGEELYVSKDRFPVGIYEEPHLAVRYGTVQFEYVKIYAISS